MENKDGSTEKGISGGLRRSDSGIEREAQSGSQAGIERFGGEVWNIPERISREAGPWTSLAFLAIGGILSQLIRDLEYQLAYHQSSIDWYRAEIQKSQGALSWHEDNLAEVEQQLESLKTQAESIKQAMADAE